MEKYYWIKSLILKLWIFILYISMASKIVYSIFLLSNYKKILVIKFLF